MGHPDFTECGKNFVNVTMSSTWERYHWHGNPSTITEAGCKALCGTGSEWYSWSAASSKINTWILPVTGVLLQAPWESNEFWKTVFALIRWVGNPMASLSYILWNIKVSGKAALMVDMACGYDDLPGEESSFASMRDSFFILIVMNQFTMRADASTKREAEGLLRIVLFSKDLQLLSDRMSRWDQYQHRTQMKGDEPLNLRTYRKNLARLLRQYRRRSVVPAFISIVWFVFSIILSIQSAFGFLGDDATAHDLALGLLLGWLPVMVLSSIVDRNPIGVDATRSQLSNLVHLVAMSLQDDEIRKQYIKINGGEIGLRQWVNSIADQSKEMENFFTDFAGQGRKR